MQFPQPVVGIGGQDGAGLDYLALVQPGFPQAREGERLPRLVSSDADQVRLFLLAGAFPFRRTRLRGSGSGET
jgi:hypothetical protein